MDPGSTDMDDVQLAVGRGDTEQMSDGSEDGAERTNANTDNNANLLQKSPEKAQKANKPEKVRIGGGVTFGDDSDSNHSNSNHSNNDVPKKTKSEKAKAIKWRSSVMTMSSENEGRLPKKFRATGAVDRDVVRGDGDCNGSKYSYG
jgi:hypothetical protein